MRRSNKGLDRASHKKKAVLRRKLGLEALEPKVVLAGNVAQFGFIDVPGGFAFQITGTDFNETNDTKNARADNIVMWTNFSGGVSTNFFVEWQDNGGEWHSLTGSVSAGDIADEAQDRGLVIGDFKGFLLKGCGGHDNIVADGSGSIGVHPNSVVPLTAITDPLFGQSLTVDGNGGNDTIKGSADDDIIRGGAGEDKIDGNQGNDTIDGGSADDVITGGSGADKIDGGDGKDMIEGGSGNDDISGGSGDDMIFGDSGDDTIDGDDGNDDISGDAGADDLSGGAGDDALRGDADDKNPEGGPDWDGWQAGPTTDDKVIIFNNDIEFVDTTGADPGEPTTNNGDKNRFNRQNNKAAFRNITFGNSQNWPLDNNGVPIPGGFDFDDYVDSWNYTGPAGASKDAPLRIRTGLGDDTQLGGMTTRDDLRGGDGNDTLAGGGGIDTLRGNDGSDLISGGAGADEIFGGDPENVDLSVEKGDILTYGPFETNRDKPIGGSPERVIVDLQGRLDWDFLPEDSKDPGGDKGDTGPDFGRGGDAQGDLIFRDNGSKDRHPFRFPENAGSDRISHRNSQIEGLIGSDFDDLLFGDVEDNHFDGGGGNDVIRPRTGSDNVKGGDGDDLLLGGDNATIPGDLLVLGENNSEEFDGGKGNDTVKAGPGRDTIAGGPGEDDLDGQEDRDAIIGGKGDDIIRLDYKEVIVFSVGAPPGSLEADPFFFGKEVEDIIDIGVFGSEGNDDFFIRGTTSVGEQIDVASELAIAETTGFSDFENNEDDLTFD